MSLRTCVNDGAAQAMNMIRSVAPMSGSAMSRRFVHAAAEAMPSAASTANIGQYPIENRLML